MDDYIKREDAIIAIAGLNPSEALSESFAAAFWAKKALQGVPSADVVERKRGEWILTPYTDCGSPVYECSVCTHGVSGDLQVRNFCPNCGADMRKGADDE